VIANLALWFGLHVVFRSIGTAGAGWMAVPVPDLSSVDLLALALAVGALVAVLWLRVKPLWMLAGSAVVGAIAFALLRA
jgi:chromate transporter